jgi:hypothetical protein
MSEMKEHVFGEVKVLEGTEKDKPHAIIRFPSMICNVVEAEAFMCHLIDGISKARQIIKDPV